MKITTEAEYLAALARIDVILDAPLGSPEEAELMRLAAAIEEYEDAHYPIEPPTPEAAAEFRTEQEAGEDG